MAISRSISVVALSLFLYMNFQAFCSPPPSPITCRVNSTRDCTVTNAYATFADRSECHSGEVAYPTTEEEVVELVTGVLRRKMEQKMRVVTSTSHSIPNLVCPDGGGTDGLVISTARFNKVLNVDTTNMTITVQSGVTLRQLIDAAATYNLSLPNSPYWEGLTVGGMLGTGAHGSSLFGKGSAVHEYVTSMRVVAPISAVDGASVIVFEESHPDFDAAKVSLGLLGIITHVTFKLEPMFKRSVSLERKKDLSLKDDIEIFGRAHEFADFTWLPAQKSVIYRRDDRVDTAVPGDFVNDFIGFRPTPSPLLAILRALEENDEITKNAKGRCERAVLQRLLMDLLYYKPLFSSVPSVGYQHKVQASGGCLYSEEDSLANVCSWDPRVNGLFFFDSGIRINLDKVPEFVSDVQELQNKVPEGLCSVEIYNGIIMRFVKASTAYLGADQDSVDFDITYYRSRDPMSARLYEDVIEEMEQMALFKYGGVPHFGKNRPVAFINVTSKYKDFDKFTDAMKTYDPMGLFTNHWIESMMGIGGKSVVTHTDGCALEGLCICSEDRHCAPTQGYFCRPGRVYQEARVCRYEETSPSANAIEPLAMTCPHGASLPALVA